MGWAQTKVRGVLRGWGQRVVRNSQAAGLGGALTGSDQSDGLDESDKVDRKRRALVFVWSS